MTLQNSLTSLLSQWIMHFSGLRKNREEYSGTKGRRIRTVLKYWPVIKQTKEKCAKKEVKVYKGIVLLKLYKKIVDIARTFG